MNLSTVICGKLSTLTHDTYGVLIVKIYLAADYKNRRVRLSPIPLFRVSRRAALSAF